MEDNADSVSSGCGGGNLALYPTSTPSTPTTPSKTFTLPLNPFQRNVTPSKSLDSGLDAVDGGERGGSGGGTPRTPDARVMRRRSNSIGSSPMPPVRILC